jgi:competence protein ComEA
MPELSRSQLLVYGAVGVTLLLVGARWIRAADERGSPPGSVETAGAASGDAGDAGPGGSLSVESAGEGDVVIHVAGAVRDPGVYRLPSGSRVADAVRRAGGADGSAVLDGINLAARLADGQQIVVPAAAKSGGEAMQGATSAAPDGPISLGTATVEQLDTIEGIGPVTAQNIVDYRDEHGGLSSVEELDEISGIGPATMEALRVRLQP